MTAYVGTVSNGKIDLPPSTDLLEGSAVLVIPATHTETQSPTPSEWLVGERMATY